MVMLNTYLVLLKASIGIQYQLLEVSVQYKKETVVYLPNKLGVLHCNDENQKVNKVQSAIH